MIAAPQSTRLKTEHRHFRDPDDWYQEPVAATLALLDVEKFDGDVFDPCCGEGNIVTACQQRGVDAFGADIVDRAGGRFGRSDFLCDADPWRDVPVDNIVMNPPFRHVEAFIERALGRARFKVAMLGRLAFLEGQRRRAAFTRWPLRRVWVFSRRINMPPAGRGIEAKGGTVAFAWFVFERGYDGKPEIGWLA